MKINLSRYIPFIDYYLFKDKERKVEEVEKSKDTDNNQDEKDSYLSNKDNSDE